VANFIFSILAFALLAMIMGRDVTDPKTLEARVAVVAGAPAATAGLKDGDLIVALNDKPIANFVALQSEVRSRPGEVVTIRIQRERSVLALPVTLGSTKERTGVSEGVLGVRPNAEPIIERPDPLTAIGIGAERVWSLVAQTGSYLGRVLTGAATPDQLSGPIGIFSASSQVATGAVSGEASAGDKLGRLALSLVMLAAFLSVAVGVANLLPLPVLDGGQLILCGVEAVRGKPLGPKAQEFSYRAGVALVASLILLATWNDLQRLKLLEFLGGMLS
jgi:regulator of sigma E protease